MNKLGCLILLIAGCATQAPQPTAEARALGIDHYDVTHTTTSLVIEGLDATDHVVGRATLKLGRFTMEDDGDVVDGRQLDVDVATKSAHHESRGFTTLSLPLDSRPAPIRTFLLDPLVARPLLAWGVGFELTGQVTAAPIETPYELSCHDPYVLGIVSSNPYPGVGGCTFGSNCSTNSCAQFNRGGGEYGEYVCCGGSSPKASERACRSPFGSTHCGQAGQLGCAPCWDDSDSGCFTVQGSYSSMHFCGL